MKKLVIVGGGFAGLTAAKVASKLRNKMEVLLVDKSCLFEYLPSLPYLISRERTIKDISEPLQAFASNNGIELIEDKLLKVEPSSNTIKLRKGGSLDYDYLILAVGANVEYFNIKNSYFALPAYRLKDYLHIIDKLKEIEEDKVVVIGAGLTGIEVAGEFSKVIEPKRVLLVEKMKNVLPSLRNEKVSEIVKCIILSKGIRLITGTGCKEINKDGIVLEDGGFIKSPLVIWTAGIRGARIDIDGIPTYGRGWVFVDKTIRVKGFDNIYAPGDINCLLINGDYTMKMAEEAILQARISIENIKRDIEGKKPIEYSPIFLSRSPKMLATVGDTGIMLWKNMVIVGRFPKIAKLMIERAFMSMVRDRPFSYSLMRFESTLLRTIDKVFN